MRTIWKAFIAVLLINALVLGGAILWLKTSGRLNRERLTRVRDVFKVPIAQEQAAKEAEAREAERNQKNATEAARRSSIGENGAVTIAQRLEAGREADEISMQRVERLQSDIASLQKQLVLAKDLLAKQKTQLETDRKAFE